MAFRTVTPAKKSTPPLLRYAHLMAFESLLCRSGAPVDLYLYRNGLPVFCEDSSGFLPLLKIWSFFDDVARHEDREIGWLVGSHVGDSKLNANLLREIESAPTLFLGMRRLMQKVSSEATDLDIGMHGHLDDYLLYMHYPGMSGVPGYAVSQAYMIGFFLGLIRHFLGQHWVPDLIGIESRHVPLMVKSGLPGCRFLTQQPAGYIVVPRSCLHRSIRPWDNKAGSAENPLLSQKSVALTNQISYIDTLRAVLKSYLAEGYLSESAAAELMGTSVRTLTRKLHDCDTTYGELIDEVRFNAVKGYLLKPNMRIGEVAQCVGFRDQSDFTRMIRRVGGLTPTALRKSLLGKVEKGLSV